MSLAVGVFKGWDFSSAETSGPRLIGCEVKHGGLQRHRAYSSLIEIYCLLLYPGELMCYCKQEFQRRGFGNTSAKLILYR